MYVCTYMYVRTSFWICIPPFTPPSIPARVIVGSWNFGEKPGGGGGKGYVYKKNIEVKKVFLSTQRKNF